MYDKSPMSRCVRKYGEPGGQKSIRHWISIVFKCQRRSRIELLKEISSKLEMLPARPSGACWGICSFCITNRIWRQIIPIAHHMPSVWDSNDWGYLWTFRSIHRWRLQVTGSSQTSITTEETEDRYIHGVAELPVYEVNTDIVVDFADLVCGIGYCFIIQVACVFVSFDTFWDNVRKRPSLNLRFRTKALILK